MKKYVKVVVFAFCICLSGCKDETQDQAMQELQSELGADSYQINYENPVNTSHPLVSILNLSFTKSSIAKIDEKICSFVAYNFYKRALHNVIKYDQLDITFKDGQKKFERSYSIKDIQLVDSLLENPIEKFFANQKTEDLRNYVDNALIDDSTLVKVVTTMHSIDSVYGKPTNYKLKGFQFKEFKEDKKPIVVLPMDVFNKEYNTHYIFVVVLENKKIGFIQINE